VGRFYAVTLLSAVVDEGSPGAVGRGSVRRRGFPRSPPERMSQRETLQRLTWGVQAVWSKRLGSPGVGHVDKKTG
jgi:hypothetical protein